MGVVVEVKELGHIVLYVRDLERSARFYRDVLGWRQISARRRPPFPSRVLRARRAAPTTSCC